MDAIEKQDLWGAVETIKPIPQALEKQIRRKGVKTGCCVFGGLGKNSDIDILFLLDRDDPVQEMLNDFYFRSCIDSGMLRYIAGTYRDENSEFLSVYVKCRFTKRPVNLLLFDNEGHYYKWVDATKVLSNMMKKDYRMKQALTKKRNRVHIFEALKHIFRR